MESASNRLLSIIVPVYNVEDYIEKNVLSVISSLSDSVEVFYIDDGSKDKSCEIIEKLIAGIENITLYKKNNSGPGATRNYGLDRARGEYVFFLDSDDYISDVSFDRLIDIAKNNKLDMLEFCYRLVNESGKELVGPNYSREESVNSVMSGADWLRTEKCCSLQVAYLYRRQFLIDNRIRMPEGVIHEDVEYVAKCVWYANRFMKINECIYNYVMRPTSIMHTKGHQHNICSHEGIYRTVDFVLKNVDDETYEAYFKPYIISEFYNYCHILIQNGESVRENLKADEPFRQDILKWLRQSQSFSKRVQYIAIRYKLYEIYTLMYKVYNRIRPNYLSAR